MSSWPPDEGSQETNLARLPVPCECSFFWKALLLIRITQTGRRPAPIGLTETVQTYVRMLGFILARLIVAAVGVPVVKLAGQRKKKGVGLCITGSTTWPRRTVALRHLFWKALLLIRLTQTGRRPTPSGVHRNWTYPT